MSTPEIKQEFFVQNPTLYDYPYRSVNLDGIPFKDRSMHYVWEVQTRIQSGRMLRKDGNFTWELQADFFTHTGGKRGNDLLAGMPNIQGRPTFYAFPDSAWTSLDFNRLVDRTPEEAERQEPQYWQYSSDPTALKQMIANSEKAQIGSNAPEYLARPAFQQLDDIWKATPNSGDILFRRRLWEYSGVNVTTLKEMIVNSMSEQSITRYCLNESLLRLFVIAPYEQSRLVYLSQLCHEMKTSDNSDPFTFEVVWSVVGSRILSDLEEIVAYFTTAQEYIEGLTILKNMADSLSSYKHPTINRDIKAIASKLSDAASSMIQKASASELEYSN